MDLGREAALQGDSRFSRSMLFFGPVAHHYGAQPHTQVLSQRGEGAER